MKCLDCGGATKVINSRYTASEQATRRRRECFVCRKRITTKEIIETDVKIGRGMSDMMKLLRKTKSLRKILPELKKIEREINEITSQL